MTVSDQLKSRIVEKKLNRIGKVKYQHYPNPFVRQDSEKGFNCYGDDTFVLRDSGLWVPKNSGCWEYFEKLESTGTPRNGDIVFTNGTNGKPGHQGIFYNGKFIHCSKEHGGVVLTQIPLEQFRGYRKLGFKF